MMSHRYTYAQPGADFQAMAMAFLKAVALSRSTLCAFVRQSIADHPVSNAEELLKRIKNIKRSREYRPFLANCYDGFGDETYGDGIESIQWHCQLPHPAVANGCFSSTVISLQKKHGLWELCVSGRDQKAVMPRIEAALGARAVSVPAKILAAINGCE